MAAGEKKTVRVLAFGTFDLLHFGHLYYLAEAKKLGTHLAVIVARDVTVKKAKGHLPINNEQHRLALVAALKPVDEAVLGCEQEKMFECAAALKPDVIALGYDQKPDNETVAAELSKFDCFPKIVRLKPFKEHLHKTSKIKARIRNSEQ